MNFKFDIDPSNFIRAVHNVQNGQFVAIRESLEAAGNEIMDDSKENYCPVDTGALQATGTVTVTGEGSHTEVLLSYGDDVIHYAVPVHEGHRIIAWGHDTGRFQPPTKYLELPMLAHAGPNGAAWQKLAFDFMAFSARAWNS